MKKTNHIKIIAIILFIVGLCLVVFGIINNKSNNMTFDGYEQIRYGEDVGTTYSFENGKLKSFDDAEYIRGKIEVNLEENYIYCNNEEYTNKKFKIIYHDDLILVWNFNPYSKEDNNDQSEDVLLFINKKYPSYKKPDIDKLIYDKYYNKSNMNDKNGYYISSEVYSYLREKTNSSNEKSVEYNKWVHQIKFLETGNFEEKEMYLKDENLQENIEKSGQYETYNLKEEYKILEKYGFSQKIIKFNLDSDNSIRDVILKDKNGNVDAISRRSWANSLNLETAEVFDYQEEPYQYKN